jgi:hypothetical protein
MFKVGDLLEFADSLKIIVLVLRVEKKYFEVFNFQKKTFQRGFINNLDKNRWKKLDNA